MNEKPYKLEDRLVRFAGESLLFCETLSTKPAGRYYGDQILRSSGSAALNYGEAQGANTDRDFIHKMSLVLKELKETRVALKILNYANVGDFKKRNLMLKESTELMAISAKMILNKKNRINTKSKV